jgi:hypothetical protein
VKSSQTGCEQFVAEMMERETGFEPATACLEGRNSTTELLPQKSRIILSLISNLCQRQNCFCIANKNGHLAVYCLSITPASFLSIFIDKHIYTG